MFWEHHRLGKGDQLFKLRKQSNQKFPKSKHLILIIYYENDKEKQQIHTFKKLDWALKYDSPSIKTFGNFVFNQ